VAALGGLFGGMFAAMAYMQVTTLSRLGEPETRVVFYFSVGSAVAGGITMLFTGISPFPAGARCGWCRGRAGGRGPGLHDPSLCLGRQQDQHSGRRQSAVLGHCVCRPAQPGAVWREHSSDRLGGIVLIVASGAAATTLRPGASHGRGPGAFAMHVSSPSLPRSPRRICAACHIQTMKLQGCGATARSHNGLYAARLHAMPSAAVQSLEQQAMNHSTPEHYNTLISVEELARLKASGKPLMVFDCSFDLMNPPAGREQYLQVHIEAPCSPIWTKTSAHRTEHPAKTARSPPACSRPPAAATPCPRASAFPPGCRP
jgi:hypothetical protein